MPWCDGDRFSNAAEPHVNTVILNAKLMHWLVETARRHYKNPTPATKETKEIHLSQDARVLESIIENRLLHGRKYQADVRGVRGLRQTAAKSVEIHQQFP